MKKIILLIAIAALSFTSCNQPSQEKEVKSQNASPNESTIDTRLGKIDIDSGYPSVTSINQLTDELDYQRACQAYIWGLPIVGLNEWMKAAENVFKVRNGQLVAYQSFEDKLASMTPKFRTPYIAA